MDCHTQAEQGPSPAGAGHPPHHPGCHHMAGSLSHGRGLAGRKWLVHLLSAHDEQPFWQRGYGDGVGGPDQAWGASLFPSCTHTLSCSCGRLIHI